MNNSEKIKKYIIFGIVAILICLIFKLGIFFAKNGFIGISSLAIILLIGGILFAFTALTCICIWVYKDSVSRGENGLLWVLIVFITSPFIGLIIYFISRKEKKMPCKNCGYLINPKSNYCEKCGKNIEIKEENNTMLKTKKGSKMIIAGVIAAILMVGCFGTFTVMAFTSDGFIDTTVWNTGVITMSYENNFGNQWTLNFKSASDGFRKRTKLKVEDTSEILYAVIDCSEGELLLHIEQGERQETIDVSNLEEPLEYSLENFETGKITVILEINGAKNAASYITIK